MRSLISTVVALTVTLLLCLGIHPPPVQAETFKRNLRLDVIDASLAIADLPANVYYQWTLKVADGKYTFSLASRSSKDDSKINWTTNSPSLSTRFSEEATSAIPEFYLGPSGKDVYFVALLRGSDTYIVVRRIRFSDGKLLKRTRISSTDCPSPYAAKAAIDPTGDVYLTSICAPSLSSPTSSKNYILIKRLGDKTWTKKLTGIFARNVYQPLAVSHDKERDNLYLAAYAPKGKDEGQPFVAAWKGQTGSTQLKPKNITFTSPYTRLTSLSIAPSDSSILVNLQNPRGEKSALFRLTSNASKIVWKKTSTEGEVLVQASDDTVYTCGTEFESEGPVRIRGRKLSDGSLIHATKVEESGGCRFIQVTGEDENVVVGTDDREWDDLVVRGGGDVDEEGGYIVGGYIGGVRAEEDVEGAEGDCEGGDGDDWDSVSVSGIEGRVFTDWDIAMVLSVVVWITSMRVNWIRRIRRSRKRRKGGNYLKLPRSVHGLKGAPEWPTVRALIGEVSNLSIIDLGCGLGYFTRWAIEQGAQSVHGIDLSEKMLETAKEDSYDAANLTYQQADLETVELKENAYDIAYSSLTLHYLPTLDHLLSQIHSSLKPDGRLILTLEHPILTAPSEPTFQRDTNSNYPYWPLNNYMQEGERITNWLAPGVRKYHRTVETYLNLFLKAGFVVMAFRESWDGMKEQEGLPEFEAEGHRPFFLILAMRKV
ncbi:hypothetical protein HK097_005303 [Rhizophlyctis rosea]|uniref:Methyltransferase type 11 domain-containing protein n=1 Tax=Rhizophlyctis rosea TaxID=64517 RepID=A0AAD5X2I4_9FUNG|nr:hypothetical protein HK097_005303 [Rhizophlyctis rosea]